MDNAAKDAAAKEEAMQVMRRIAIDFFKEIARTEMDAASMVEYLAEGLRVLYQRGATDMMRVMQAGRKQVIH